MSTAQSLSAPLRKRVCMSDIQGILCNCSGGRTARRRAGFERNTSHRESGSTVETPRNPCISKYYPCIQDTRLLHAQWIDSENPLTVCAGERTISRVQCSIRPGAVAIRRSPRQRVVPHLPAKNTPNYAHHPCRPLAPAPPTSAGWYRRHSRPSRQR